MAQLTTSSMEPKTTTASKVNTTLTKIQIENLINELFSAIKESNVQKVKYYIEKATEIEVKNEIINAKDGNHNTPLQQSVITGDEEIVKTLFINGANTYGFDKDGKTLLDLAVKNDHLNIVKYLIEEKHVDIEVRSKNGNNPLHTASSSGKLNT